jgi:hypothetical protein
MYFNNGSMVLTPDIEILKINVGLRRLSAKWRFNLEIPVAAFLKSATNENKIISVT